MSRSVPRSRTVATALTVMALTCPSLAGAQAGGATPTGFELPPLSLDPSFAGDGTTLVPIAQRDLLYAGFIESSGEIVLFGESDDGSPSNREAIMQRLAVDGAPGTTSRFPAGGFGCSAPRSFLTARRLEDGNYLTGGYVQEGCTGTPRLFNTFRLAPSGGVLTHFDTVPFNNQIAYVYGVAQQADGRIVVAGLVSGVASVESTFDFGVARLMSDGALDASFGNGGTLTFDFENDLDYALDVVIDQDDRILLGGIATSSAGGRDMLVIALDASGDLDTSFADNGIFRYDRAGFTDSLAAIVQHPDGRLLLAGVTSPTENEREFSVMALTEDGEIDLSFGSDGLAVVDFGTAVAAATAMAIGPGQLVSVAGFAEIGGSGREFRDAAIAVLRPDGTLSPRFNAGAGFTFAFGDPADGLPVDFAQTVHVEPTGGRILVAGISENLATTIRQFGAARLIGIDPDVFRDGFEPEE